MLFDYMRRHQNGALAGLHPVCGDVDSYFKDVFAGPLF